MFVEEKLVKKEAIEKRNYQINISNSCTDKNSLVVLPTGLGKTIIALILISRRLSKFKDSKVLFLAPTKPLVVQHADFLRKNLVVNNNDIVVFTGEVSPNERKEVWKKSKIIVSTPQVIENDLISKRFSLSDVSLIVFDECHHAVGDYSYVFVSEMYQKQRKSDRVVLGITASPGNDVEKILEVCKNLDVVNIEIRSKFDLDVRPYVHDLKISWKEVPLPSDFTVVVQLLRKGLSRRLKLLKEMGFLESGSISRVNRTKLLEAQRKIQGSIRDSVKPSKGLFNAASTQSEAMKIHYGLELLTTQGVNAFLNYFQRMVKEANSKGGSKSSRVLMMDNDIVEAIAFAKTLDVEHPKSEEIVKIVQSQFKQKKSSKIIVFTHYRDTSRYITELLSGVKGVHPARFIGQATKEGDKGLTQKQQAEIVQDFKKDKYNVLIATSVAEEGLDIPSTDLVVFFEPIPSEIRFIQRRGRTGRKMPGKVVILITKGTSDEGYYWSAKRKEKRMRSELDLIRNKLDKHFENADELYKDLNDKDNQKSLSDFKKEKNDVKIVVDHREYRSNVVKNLVVKGIFVEPSQLDVGDYVLSSRIGVERKNVDDFLSSLIEGKLFKQLSSLRDTYSRPVLIIEGENILTKRNMSHNAIFGSIASISVDFGIPVLMTKNASETARMLYVIARREQKDDKKVVAVRGEKTQMSTRERQQFVIEGLPNVSGVIAKRLLSHFGSIRDIANATEEDLCKVPGIGKNIAGDIIDLLNSEYKE